MKTLSTNSEFNLHNFINGHEDVYTPNIHIQRYAGFDDYCVTDTTNAMKAGKTCSKYRIIAAQHQHGTLDVTNWISANFGDSLEMLMLLLNGLEFPDTPYGNAIELDTVSISKDEVQGVRTFSPFACLPKLTATPKKWTLRHVYQALFNGQFTDLKCKGVYTDDYAYDAACNFQQGAIKNAIHFVKRIMESPSGWRAYEYNGKVSICCHSFDNNEFVPSI